MNLKRWWRRHISQRWVVVSERGREEVSFLPCRTQRIASEIASDFSEHSMLSGDGWYSFFLPANTVESYLAKREYQRWLGER